MKNTITLALNRKLNLIFLSVLFALTVCKGQTFTTLQSVPGTGNDFDDALIFELNGKIYVGGGFYSKKLYQYNVTNDAWTVKNDLPNATYSRCAAMAFTINNTAYILNGRDINPSTFTSVKLNDFYQYDEVLDSWIALAAPPFIYRSGASVFVINNKAYVVGGTDNTDTYTNTTWEYDGTAWLQRANFPLANISWGSAFVLNGKGYIACGSTRVASVTTYNQTLYEFNPVSNVWTQKANFPGSGRSSAFGFTAGPRGYCGQGSSVSPSFQYIYYSDFYSYNATLDSWALLTATFPANTRQAAVAVTYNNFAYLGTGWTFISGNNTYYRDWYKFDSGIPTEVGENKNTDMDVNIYPNPVAEVFTIEGLLTESKVKITDYCGKIIFEKTVKNGETINISNLSPGTYFVKVLNEQGVGTRKIQILD